MGRGLKRGGSHALEAAFCFIPISRSVVEIRAFKVLQRQGVQEDSCKDYERARDPLTYTFSSKLYTMSFQESIVCPRLFGIGW